MFDPDSAFKQRIVDVFGDDGAAWLQRLPALVDEYAARWNLRVGAPLSLHYNYVAAATQSDGTEAVLKAGVPDTHIAHEIAALEHWAGNGAVRVLEADAGNGVVLLERLVPGREIIELEDQAATRIAARLMRRLWGPTPTSYPFPTLFTWGNAFHLLRERRQGTTGPLPAELLDTGEALYFELVGSQAEPVLLHGDVHHRNVLSNGRDNWLLIDPHGVVGEPAFEVGTWMRNPVRGRGTAEDRFLLANPDPRRVLERRLSIFADELGLDRARLRDWSIAACALSAAWSDEGGHTESALDALAVAELLTTM